VRKLLTLFFGVYSITTSCFSQTEKEVSTPIVSDSIKTKVPEEVAQMQDTIFVKRKAINPLAPSKAAFLSATLPGLGQVYNKKYWKVPLVYGAIGGSVYMYTLNNDNYQRFRTAFKRRQAGFIDDEFFDLNGDNLVGQEPDLDLDDLENQQERFQRDRDLWLVVSILMYTLNIVDANVDAHLKQFNIDSDLSLNFEPYYQFNDVNNSPNYGMALIIKF